MIPLRDDAPSRSWPFVTWALVAANVAVFAHEVRLGPAVEALFGELGLVPARFHAEADPVARALPVLTSMFLHGGLLHLAGNMLYLHIFGDNVEDRLGHLRFLLFYLVCGAVAGLSQVVLFPASETPMVGASGAIAGVTGAYFVSFPRARVLTAVPVFFYVEIVRVPAVFFLLLWFLIQLAYGALSIGVVEGAAGGVAWWAHVGGFAAGMLLVRPLRRRR